MKIAALLLRCSTDAQDYERQKLDLIDATKRLGYSTSDELIFGQYITGKDNVRNKDRESIALCKQAVLEKRVDAIFDWKEKGHPLGCSFFVYFHFYIKEQVSIY